MEKQVLIEVLEKYQNGYQEKTDGYFEGAYDAYGVALRWIKKLDEQPKVTVPQFVADWINQCKEKATLADCLNGYYQISNGEVVGSTDFQNWVVDNENDELAAKAWIFGYEVEKEPLYQIELPGTSWGAYLTKADNGDLVIFQNTTSGSAFTESEIKSIDERYWAFAVPTEEVK
ncbi:DUF1642 domain-containing protein [Enterococcus gallinarum]|uniref:DUF1642 domain-containing protein n=1 Tax=Enterococcus gallinarum TaxID=1353 RepID=UPI001D0646D7|nr:DUF1642 domain-containing protein [Enterococcus gallinarum]MCB7450374.1 DUF1642 domain-containing protein [Enterococcus gallinarum]